jgi:hypothetical protein
VLGLLHDLYEITSESYFGVAPFGRTWIPDATWAKASVASEASEASNSSLGGVSPLTTPPLRSSGRPRQAERVAFGREANLVACLDRSQGLVLAVVPARVQRDMVTAFPPNDF